MIAVLLCLIAVNEVLDRASCTSTEEDEAAAKTQVTFSELSVSLIWSSLLTA